MYIQYLLKKLWFSSAAGCPGCFSLSSLPIESYLYFVNMGRAPSTKGCTMALVVKCSKYLVVSNLRFLGFFSTEARKSRSRMSKERDEREVPVVSGWKIRVSLRPVRAK